MSDAVTLEVRDRVAHLTLNRPEVNNAIDGETAATLRRHVESLRGRDDVRAVLVASTGKMFCAGGKLDFVAGAPDPGAAMRGLADDVHAALLALAALDAPVVCAVQGVAAGGGFGLALCGDVVLAGDGAMFTLAYTNGGLTPDAGATWLLPRLVGARKAAELVLLNPRVKAPEALALGLVTRVVPDEALASEAEAIAAQLAAGPLRAHASVRRLLASSLGSSLEEQLGAEASSIAEQAGGPEGAEGMAAFLQKRRPEF